MNRIVKIDEQQLKNLVKEAIDELKYNTYKNAYRKMQSKGQLKRASDFHDAFKKVYNNANTSFNLDRDEVWLSNPDDTEGDGQCNPTLFNRDCMRRYVPGRGFVNVTSPSRTTNRALARDHAKKINFYYGGNSPYDKNDFIAECVDKVLSKYLK